MKAVILAAGEGKRLGNLTKNLPKCMLKFNGKSLIEWQVDTLRNEDIKDISIVKGYMAEKIKIKGVKNYFSKNYANTNMVESLFCAEKELNDDVLICYSDILYEKRIIEKIKKNVSKIGVVVDENYLEYWKARLGPGEDIESLVVNKEGNIMELGKPNCSFEEAKVRYVGLLRFSKEGGEILKKVYHENKEKYYDKEERWLNSKSFRKAYMTDMLQAIINEMYKVEPIGISGGWLEFDTKQDYEKYNKWLKEGSLDRFFSFDK